MKSAFKHLRRRALPSALLALVTTLPVALAADAVPTATLVQRILARDATLQIVDVRTSEEFAASHIVGARNIPHDRIEAQASALPADKNAEIVVYCRSGRRSAMAQASLQKLGYTHVTHLEGDFIGWQAANRPVEGVAAAPAASADAKPNKPQ